MGGGEERCGLHRWSFNLDTICKSLFPVLNSEKRPMGVFEVGIL